MRKLLTIFLLSLTTACSKSDNDPQIVICPGYDYPSWLMEKEKGLSSCVCETAFLTGTYKGHPVFEQHLVDPYCNGIDVVYDYNGNILFTSLDQAEFNKYKAQVTGLHEIWRCSKTATQ